MKRTWLTVISAVFFVFCVQSAVLAEDYGTITVDGYAQETYRANQSVLVVTNTTEDDALAAAKAENDSKSAKFRESLRDLGITDKDIRTMNYVIQKKRYWVKEQEMYRETQMVTNTLQVTVNDLTKTSRVIDAAAAAGITNVRLSKLDLTAAEKAVQRQTLLVKAAKDARQKAEAIAEALGTRIIGVESLNVGGYGYRGNHYAELKMADVAGAAPGSAIEAGEDTEDMHVSVTFKIK